MLFPFFFFPLTPISGQTPLKIRLYKGGSLPLKQPLVYKEVQILERSLEILNSASVVRLRRLLPHRSNVRPPRYYIPLLLNSQLPIKRRGCPLLGHLQYPSVRFYYKFERIFLNDKVFYILLFPLSRSRAKNRLLLPLSSTRCLSNHLDERERR